MSRFSSLVRLTLLCCSALSNAFPSANSASAPAKRASNACGQIVNSGELVFEAKIVYECLTSVPFNDAVATRFLNYYNETMQFQSTLAYLKNPPASYQQPSVDFIFELGRIQTAINTGVFKNQYEFEATLMQLVYSAHDTHVDLVSGIMGVFSFGTEYSIVSLSLDGVALPKIYLSDDILESQSEGAIWKASAVAQINGMNVLDYLMEFASINAFGTIESHADFNQLMTSPAQDIQGVFNTWGGGAAFYPGETLTIVLENSTTISTPWLAVFNNQDTGPLETGGDFYNFFVLGLYPDSYDPYASLTDSSTSISVESSSPTSTSASEASSTISDSSASSTSPSSSKQVPSGWDSLAYPLIPDVAQPDLGTYGGGFISGYFIGNDTAVLSIPSFVELGEATGTFSDTIALFLIKCTQEKIKKLVIDLQGNTGGTVLLAFDAFKRFFPRLEPYGGSRMRAHEAANVLGETITSYWNELDEDYYDYYSLAADEWMVSDRISAATKKNFTSWKEFYGPVQHNGDLFTTVQQYNLSNVIFDMEATENFDEYFAVYGYDGNPAASNATSAFKASDIVILSDGLCASACSIFMHMMHTEAGVKTVVAGGYPMNGPMQAASGTRGARDYSVTEALDNNIAYAQEILQYSDSSDQNFLPNRTNTLGQYWIDYMGINLRDQIKKGSDVPLQFLYEAANCRIFYTPETFYNYTALWNHAAAATWTDPSLCVKGSTGYASTNGTLVPAPSSANVEAPSTPSKLQLGDPSSSMGAIILAMLGASSSSIETSSITATKNTRSSHSFEGQDCSVHACAADYYCTDYSKSCSNGKPVKYKGCVAECKMYPGYCRNSGTCQPVKKATDPKKETSAQLKVTLGYCSPPVPACGASTKKTKYTTGPSESVGYKKRQL